MATVIGRMSANTTWQEAVQGPMVVTLNQEHGFSLLYVGGSAPAADEANTFIYKPVAGENYLDIKLESGDTLFIRSVNTTESTICWIASAVA